MTINSICSAQTTGYHIGNSLTWDSSPTFLDNIASSQGISLTLGHHINCNRSLIDIWNNPEQTCIDPIAGFGYYLDALTVDLDYVTAQPFWSKSSTLGSDEQVFSDFAVLLDQNPNNTDTTIYLYQAWGADWFMSNGDWYNDVLDSDMTPTTASDEYFVHLYNRLTSSHVRPIRIIPVGQVIDALNTRITEGNLFGVSSIQDLYRDSIHMSYDLGRFAASVTTIVVLLDIPPFGLHEVWIEQFGDGGYDRQTFVDIENTIWDIVSQDSRTGVNPCLGDANRDGNITPSDFTAWISAFNSEYSIADQNRDGYVTPADFTAWINNYNAGCS